MVAILLMACLLNLEGSYIDNLEKIEIFSVPKYGRYLEKLDTQPLTVSCFLQTGVFSFEILRHKEIKKGDLTLKVTRHLFDDSQEKLDSVTIPMWIFWHKPSLDILKDIKQTSDFPVIIYLKDFDDMNGDNQLNLTLIKIPDPLQENLEAGVTLLTNEICYWLEEWV